MSTYRLAAAFLTCLVLMGCVSKGRFEEQVAENQRLERQRTNLISDLDSANTDNARLNREVLDLAERMAQQQEKWRNEVQTLQTSLDDKDNQLDQMYRQSDTLAADKQALHNQLEREKVARAARIATLRNTYDQLVGTLEEELERERALREARAKQIKEVRQTLGKTLATELGNGTITLSEKGDQLTIQLASNLLFNSGRSSVNTAGQSALKKVGQGLASLKNHQIRVEGHTDSVPITGPLKDRYPSNWELSTARASSVVRFLQTASGINGEQLAAVGLGPYRPVADNKTSEGRAQNRRIEIVVAPTSKE